MLDLDRLRAELALACDHAGLSARSFVVFVVRQRRPEGTTPIAYLQPAGFVWPDTVVVFRAAGAERVQRHYLAAHRLAIWSELPGLPDAALGPMLRHELEHARRWERSGTRFFEADDQLRAAVRRSGGHGYSALPSELEANAASAEYAEAVLSPSELEAVAASPECAGLLARRPPPADVVEATLGQLAEREDWGLGMSSDERRAYIAEVREACGRWDVRLAADLTADRDAPAIELTG